MFGGVSIIAVGGLFQLKPVFHGWIFNDLSADYGPDYDYGENSIPRWSFMDHHGPLAIMVL